MVGTTIPPGPSPLRGPGSSAVRQQMVQDLAQEEDPGRQAVQVLDQEDNLGCQAAQVLARVENLGRQAAPALAKEEPPGLQALDATQVVDGDMVKMTIEVGAYSAKKHTIVGVANVDRIFETAELDENAASVPVVMQLDEAENTNEDDILALDNLHSEKEKSVKDAEETDCDAQDATEEQHETADDAKKTTMAGIAEETTELYENIARIPAMEKAEADEPKEATLTEAVDIAPPNAKFQEDNAANGDGVQDVKGECDQGLDLQDDPPDDRDGNHVRDHPPDAGGDDKEHFSDTEVSCSLDDEDKAGSFMTTKTD